MFGWEFPPHNSGGLGVACFGLTRALAQLGLDVTFVMPKKLNVGAPWARFVFADMPHVKFRGINSTITAYQTSSSTKTSMMTVRRAAAGSEIYGSDLMSDVLRYALAAREIAQDEEFDVIYAHDWLSFGAGIMAKEATGKPLIAHVHATEIDRTGGRSSVNPDVFELEREGMEAADVVVAVSEYTKQMIVKEYGIPASKIRVVHNGIDDETMPKPGGWLPRLRQMKKAGFKIVLFLGRITLQKGPDYFIRVAKRVTEKNPKVMFIVSGSGDMEGSMMQLAAQLGVSNNVLFTGFVTGPERYEMYSAADLFAMPSVSEPFGITPLEAMKTGTPVLVSKQSGISEVVKHALKVDFWDVDEMSNQILALVEHPGLSETLSQNASMEADRLTWLEAGRKVDSIIQEVA
jgi:glycosyltransferase involved in cell wall biosynthesis